MGVFSFLFLCRADSALAYVLDWNVVVFFGFHDVCGEQVLLGLFEQV